MRSNSSWFVFPRWHVFTKSKLKCWHKSTTFKFVINVAGCANCSYGAPVMNTGRFSTDFNSSVMVILLALYLWLILLWRRWCLVSVYFLDYLSLDPCPVSYLCEFLSLNLLWHNCFFYLWVPRLAISFKCCGTAAPNGEKRAQFLTIKLPKEISRITTLY